jgi:type IV secretion system protein VirD4
MLLFAGTGQGKTSKIIVNSVINLSRSGSSIIINDPAAEIRLLTSGHLAKIGYKIYVIDLANPQQSHGLNPIIKARESASARSKVAKQLVGQTDKGKDDFWNSSAEQIFVFVLELLSLLDERCFTITNIARLIDAFGSPKTLDWLVVQHATPELLLKYKSIIGMDSKTMSNIIATCKSKLVLWNDPAIQRISSFSDIAIAKFRIEKSILYITGSPVEQAYYKPYISLVFQAFFDVLLAALPSKKDLPVFYVIDEASSMEILNINALFSNVRKYLCGILLCYQSPFQIVDQYGQNVAKALNDNAFLKMYLGGGHNIETATMLEKTLGLTEIEVGENKTAIRPLMASDEIRQLKENEALVLCSNYKPYKIKTKPYFKQFYLRWITSISPFEIENVLPDEVPLVPLPKPPVANE